MGFYQLVKQNETLVKWEVNELDRKKEMPGYMTYREAALMFSLMPDDEAAKAIKATVNYYLYGTKENLQGVAGKVFEIMRADIDRGRVAYKKKCDGAKKGNDGRWGKGENG